MAIKVYGHPYSGATLRVLAALHEKELDYQLVNVDLKSGEQKQEPLISLNPFGKVPALEDGDLKLFESRAITKYIAYAYESNGTPLVPEEKTEKALMGVWMEVEAHQFEPVCGKIAWELFFKGLWGMEPDMAVVEENEAKLGAVLNIYEARLAQSKYLAGDSYTLADLHHYPFLHILTGTQTKKVIDERPHVSAWCKDLLARPSWEKAVALQKQV